MIIDTKTNTRKSNPNLGTLLVLVALAMMAMMLAATPSYASTTFTVDSTADTQELTPGLAGEATTLRDAIARANSNNNPTEIDRIEFNIPGTGVHTISPNTELPSITEPVIINGYSQPDASVNTLARGTNAKLLIQINGADGGGTGLTISASNSVVKGLVINRVHSDTIEITPEPSADVVTNVRIEGNFLGTDPSGTLARPNGEQGVGVLLFDVSDNTVGGASRASRNLISGNGLPGVVIEGDSTTSFGGADNNLVRGNLIGTQKDGLKPLGNGLSGVDVLTDETDATADGNRILSNSIFSNEGPGIDLGDGVTPNEFLDLDQGPNNRQNFPVLNSARTADGATSIEGSFNSLPNTPFVLQFYSNPAGGDEGKKVVDEKAVTTDAQGNAFFTFTLARLVGAGQNITATARNTSPVRGSTADTSEFSAPVKVQDLTHPSVKTTVPAPNATGVSPTANITAAFSEAMKASTVNATTVTLKKAGTTKNLASTVSYASVSKKATLNPGASLVPGASYVAKVSTNAKDKAGNALDQNPSLSGNQAKIWKFTVKK